MKAEAEASKLRADANVARLYGRTTAASGLEASADAVLQAASAQQANAVAYRNQLAAAIATEQRNAPADLADAAARIREAEAAVKRARLAVELATLRAPFAGTVAEITYKVGEVPSVTDGGILLSDITGWQIEVSNLPETSLPGIEPGTPVTVLFDALGGLVIPGKVDYVSTVGTFAPGSIGTTYRALITLNNQDPRLRSDMSASVTFLSEDTAAEPESAK
jgi:multidrug resistance efflux pump